VFITRLSYEHIDTIEANSIETLKKGQQPSLLSQHSPPLLAQWLNLL
jgi:uncharacterized protein (DUF2249 family)